MEEKLSVRQRVRQQDSVLGVEKWEEHLVVSSCFVTLESLDETNQRRIVADDTQEDESLTVRNERIHVYNYPASLHDIAACGCVARVSYL